ncbi:amidase family protein [Phreatobacter sp. AB_2022a]|uniref:amidase family protein n=1 Tax=Phreatobacter sp. AB_2022a TaxID=3003134 RepID=UPI002287596F|nr:amidase family protein [Phreatobacter sp. AB_2022a]MCZ0737042.1 amidase family protein [Phreatobacter sp. AB_2022a]
MKGIGNVAKAPIWQWSAVETAAAIKKGKVSSEEVVRAHVERMHQANPKINAVVVDLSKDAIKAAKAADKALAKGKDVGPLHGVPVTIKINIDVQGQANSNGVVALKDNIAPGDSPVTSNLKKAGAVIIGLTNTPEFSMRGFTDNPLHGLTLNPWDPAVTCGGSSGGAGASVAMGIGTIAHGNDIGGSLRWPAQCNGIATIKPTQGRIPAFNPSATAERPLMAQFMSSQGPMAREVRDVRLGLEVMAQRDPRDPWWVPAPLKGPKPKGPIKVALAKIPRDMDTDRSVIALVRKAADHLSDAGYNVSEVEVPDLGGVWQLWCNLIMTELAVLQEEQMRATTSADFQKTLDGFLKLSTRLDQAGYMKAIADRSRHIRNWMTFLEDYPLVLTPTTVKRTPETNADLGGDKRVRELFHNDLRFISSINVLGLPAAVVPAGINKGLPVGVQIVGSRYREDLCLDAAAAIESRVGIVTKELWGRG